MYTLKGGVKEDVYLEGRRMYTLKGGVEEGVYLEGRSGGVCIM